MTYETEQRCLRIGLIGLGSVAQTVHVAVLRQLWQQFEIVIGFDVSPQTAEYFQKRFGIATSSEIEKFLEARLDVVAVLSSDLHHGEAARIAAQMQAHLFIEKPLSLSLQETRSIIGLYPNDLHLDNSERNHPNLVAMLGYMRVHSEAAELAREHLADMGGILSASATDITAPNRYFIDQVSEERRFADLPKDVEKHYKERERQIAAEMHGYSLYSPEHKAFRLLCSLGIHDISVLTMLIGYPKKVLSTSVKHGGHFVTSLLDYGDFYLNFECGICQVGRFDAQIRLTGERKRLVLQYDSPYIRHLPTTLQITQTDCEEHTESLVRPTFTDPYIREWQHFYNLVTGEETENKTPLARAEKDLLFIQEIMARIS